MDEYSTTPNHLEQKFKVGYEYIKQVNEAIERLEKIKEHLTLIERPKKLVKKTMWRSVCRIQKGEFDSMRIDEYLFNTKEEALDNGLIVCGAVAYEVELLEGGGD